MGSKLDKAMAGGGKDGGGLKPATGKTRKSSGKTRS
jgi:hypothetical protein